MSGSEHDEIAVAALLIAEQARRFAEDAARMAIGPQGDPGVRGPQGEPGIDGLDGQNGRDGLNGSDGAHGIRGADGATGIQGPKGDRGEKGDPGLSVQWLGPWDASRHYAPLDIVSYNASSWICTAVSFNDAPPGTTWQLLAKGWKEGHWYGGGGGGSGGTTGPIPASRVTVTNVGYTNAQEVLDALLFVALSYSMSGGSNHETGSSVASVSLSWSRSKSVDSQTLDGTGATTPTASATAQVVTGPFTSNQTWTIHGTLGAETASASTTLSFLPSRYWGVSANATLTDGQIIALAGSELSATRVQTRTGLAPSAQYIYFAWPSSFGTPAFLVNGLLNTAWTKVRSASAFVNASGASLSYDLWRSDNLLTSSYNVEVQ